jgi:excisionase family DNA binding protein
MEKLVVSPCEAAKMLATRPDNIRKLCESGEISHYKVGRNIKIPVKILEEYVIRKAKENH